MSQSNDHARSLDIRPLTGTERHVAVFRNFDILPPGGHFELVSDREPVDLLRRFETFQGGCFTWECRMRRRDEWLVTIGRRRAPANAVRNGCGERNGRGWQ
ncbi:DUF2249 domain-containing protein [Antarcticirhabdus aurantiaca]|uniref:DUF2249 domain-containing protein n=1 Tax=Antarcticirhabdus aurantiaca TaxID=2606717 RepID=A0ACD4NRQ8_9HYPH|nr:DUF2249 domain-containing protein [Antarcticirhabdus aurantiaca]WAJ29479.1 DUF2249 domain-containing protein [Jeongeuplla avenae]